MTTNRQSDTRAALSDRELIDAARRAAADERGSTAALIRILAQIDARRAYLGEGYSSLFTFCTQALHLSEHAAYHRIEAARAAADYPVILDLLTSGGLTLTTVAMLRPHLTPENHEQLLEGACHKSKREVEYQVACLAPAQAASAVVKRIPASTGAVRSDTDTGERREGVPATLELAASPPSAEPASLPSPSPITHQPTPRPIVFALAADKYLLRITLSAEAHGRLRQAQALMRHVVPDGNPERIIDKALELLVSRLQRAKMAEVSRGRRRRAVSKVSSRHIPAAVRRAVWSRDAGRCAFVGASGRCTETAMLEYHHIRPLARGGAAIVDNIALRCRAHNQYEAELVFGNAGPRHKAITR